MMLAPLHIVPVTLLQAVASSPAARARAEGLLSVTCELDSLLSISILAEPTPECDCYTFDPAQYDLGLGTEIFRKIRAEKERIAAELPCLTPAVEWTDYVSHLATNILGRIDRKRRLVATVDTGDARNILYHNQLKASFESSLAIYLGLSPFPVFGVNIDYARPEARKYLSGFGFGVFAYLHLVLSSDAAWNGLPAEFDHMGIPRPVSPPVILRESTGSLILVPQS